MLEMRCHRMIPDVFGQAELDANTRESYSSLQQKQQPQNTTTKQDNPRMFGVITAV